MNGFPLSEPVWLQFPEPEADMVNAPPHYSAGMPAGVEVIDIIESQDFCRNLANTTKYLLRAKHKGKELEDLKKSRWYLDRRIAILEEASA